MKPLSDEARKAAEAYFVTPRAGLALEAWFSAIQVLERMMKESSLEEWGELMLVSGQNIAIIEEATPALLALRWKTPSESSPEYISRILDHWMVSLSVSFAREKLRMLLLGIITAPDGDLRKARLLPPSERALKSVRWKRFRETPEHIAGAMAEAVRKSDFGFFRKLSTALKMEAENFPFGTGGEVKVEQSNSDLEEIRELFLKAWATPQTDSNGNLTPPLCYFTSEALCEYLLLLREKAASQQKAVPKSEALEDVRGLGMVWERLGLRRSRFATLTKVEANRTRRDGKLGDVLKVSN